MESPAADPEIPGCRGREVLGRIGDKWSLYVIHLLGGGTRRFSELRRQIGDHGVEHRKTRRRDAQRAVAVALDETLRREE